MRKPDKYQDIKEVISQIFHESRGRYGYRLITPELHNRGYAINHNTVQKLMNTLGLKCEIRKRRYRSYKGRIGEIAPNILKRDFHAHKPN